MWVNRKESDNEAGDDDWIGYREAGFQVHGIDAAGQGVLRRKLSRSQLLEFVAKLPRCLAGIEACVSSHYRARELSGDLKQYPRVPLAVENRAYFFWYRGLRVLGPTRTAVYSNLQPIVALLVAWAFLNETPTIFQGVGAATIIAGVFLTRA